MVANELRIGNWVKIKEEFSDRDLPLETLEFQIEGFNDGSNRYEEGAKQILFWNIKNKVFGTTTSGSYDIECEPILLTEEWLLKFNIKQDEWFCDNSYKLSHNKLFENYDVSVCNVNKTNIVCFADVKYVHQLQNLYFALTGEELKVLKEI